NECAGCGPATARAAWAGRTFTRIRDTVCDRALGLEPGGTVLFLGGTNDDLLWGLTSGTWPERAKSAGSVLRGLLTRHVLPTRLPVEDPKGALDHVTESSVRWMPQQRAAIEEAIVCTDARRVRFVFFHDFFILDLRAGRSQARRAMMEQRRAATE